MAEKEKILQLSDSVGGGEPPPDPCSQSNLSSVQIVNTALESSKNPTKSHSLLTRNEGGERGAEVVDGSQIVTPTSLAHHQHISEAAPAASNLSLCTAILQHEKKTALPNYSTTSESNENFVDEAGRLKTELGDVILSNDVDVYSFGEHLNEVFEASMRNSFSVLQGVENRNVMRRAAFHIFKGNVGAGVFLLPTYYRDAGYGTGVVVVLFLGVVMIDCVLALVHAKHMINSVEVKTYPAVVGHVLGKALMYFTKFSLIFTQFGFCVVYLQYASSMFAALFTTLETYRFFIFINILVVTPMTFFSHRIGLLSYASMLAAAFVTIVLAGALGVESRRLAEYGLANGTAIFVPMARLLVFISGHMFALEGIGVVLPVENSVLPGDYQQFSKLVKYTLAFIILLYIVFGVLGYLAFGETLKTSVVLAMPQSTSKIMLQVFLGLSLIFGYPIQYVPAIQLVDRTLGISETSSREMAFFVRILLNLFFGTLAGFIGPDTINIFASFLGAFAGVHLMITVPVFLALFTNRVVSEERDGGPLFSDYVRWFFTWPNELAEYRWYVYLVFAFAVWIGGTYYTFESVFM